MTTDVNYIDIFLVSSTGVIRNFLACSSKFRVFIRNWSACFEKGSFLYAGSYCIHIYIYVYEYNIYVCVYIYIYVCMYSKQVKGMVY